MNNSSLAQYANLTVGCPSSVSTAFTTLLSTISLLTLVGNVLVVITFIKTTDLRTSSNYYLINLAISDVICVMLNWPLYATEGMLRPGGSLISQPILASISCKLGIYTRSLSYAVSILSLMLIAIERFIATVFPLKAVQLTGEIRKTFLFLSWLLPALGLVPFLIYAKIIDIKGQSFCRNMMSNMSLKIYYFLSFVLFYCAPLILILILYPLILRHLRRETVQLEEGGPSERCITRKSKRLSRDRNIMKIFGAIVSGFFICWTPQYAYLFLKSLYPSIFTKDKCLVLVGLFYYFFPLLSTALNPLILIAFSSSYRAAVKSFCSCLSLKRRSNHIAPGSVSKQLGKNSERIELE